MTAVMEFIRNPFVFTTTLALAGLALMAVVALIGEQHD